VWNGVCVAWSKAKKEHNPFIYPITENKFSTVGLRAQEKREEEEQEQEQEKEQEQEQEQEQNQYQEQEKRGPRGRGVSNGVLPPYMLRERFPVSKFLCMIAYVCVYA
jgi:hypothetical protein